MTAEPSLTGKLLVVDDDAFNRDMLSRRLQRKGFDVGVAEDGTRALELIADESFDLVLLDIMMPGIDGLQVLERVRIEYGPTELPIIMATAKDESDDIVGALRLGANDYVTKPLDFAVVLARVGTQLALRRATAELASANERMKRDLDAAALIQQAMMPTSLPEVAGARFAWRFLPCDELAGDTLDVFPMRDGRVGMYLLDVSGHGVPAALMSVALGRILSHMDDASLLYEREGDEVPVPLSPGALARRLNGRFPMNPETRQYFTIAYGLLEPATSALAWVGAAHPGPLVVSATGAVTPHAPSGMAIGWFPQAVYEEHTLDLEHGDRVYFFSDGLIEAAREDEEQFGLDRIGAALSRARDRTLDESLDVVLEELQAWRGEQEPDDDISLLALEIE